MKAADAYQYTNAAYQRFVNDFGPDDFNSLKQLTYRHISKLSFMELIALLRLSCYDATFFVKIFPWLKKVSHTISANQRARLVQTLHQVWEGYFDIEEPYDLAFELGGFFYDLGYYREALDYFQFAINVHGHKVDLYYNRILCYYQLRKDELFKITLKEAKVAFPNSTKFEQLDKLDLTAV